MKLNRHEIQSIKNWAEQSATKDRGNTWTGFRPVVFQNNKKFNKKSSRKESKMICKIATMCDY